MRAFQWITERQLPTFQAILEAQHTGDKSATLLKLPVFPQRSQELGSKSEKLIT
jgi:hypothetical protein